VVPGAAGLLPELPAAKKLNRSKSFAVNLWLILSINSVTLGGLLFLLSAGFSLIFGLMRIPNLTHGSMFMLGAYLGTSLIAWGFSFWAAALAAGLGVALFGGIIERFVLRRLAGAELAQVLVTLGLSFMVADVCLMQWGGDPISVDEYIRSHPSVLAPEFEARKPALQGLAEKVMTAISNSLPVGMGRASVSALRARAAARVAALP